LLRGGVAGDGDRRRPGRWCDDGDGVGGEGKGDGAGPQVEVVQMVRSRGWAFSTATTHLSLLLTSRHCSGRQQPNRNRQAAARLKVEQSLSHIIDIDVVTTLCPSGNNSITLRSLEAGTGRHACARCGRFFASKSRVRVKNMRRPERSPGYAHHSMKTKPTPLRHTPTLLVYDGSPIRQLGCAVLLPWYIIVRLQLELDSQPPC
jgi:hypothetical protein